MPPAFSLDIPLSHGDREIVEQVGKAGKHGITTDRLFDRLYGQDPNGGPDSGLKAVHARICALNKHLRPRGWCVRGENLGSSRAYGRYMLYRIDQEISNAAE